MTTLLPRPRVLELDDATTVTPSEPVVRIGDASLPAEGYAVTIPPVGSVVVDAADAAGAFYARMTLRQLAREHAGAWPVATVRDWPDFPNRGVMLDVSRDKVPTMATLRALVDRLAEWKVNHLELYAEHTFAYTDHEVVWRDASPFTPPEIDDLDAYCRDRHVTLVPNQNCLGHMNRWLRHDPYRALAMDPSGYEMMGMRYGPSTIEPTNPGSLALVRGLLAELLPHFSDPRFVHLGLDEPWELPSERFDDYLAWLRTLRALPELDGRELLVWGDILAPHPDRLAELPAGVTVCEWGYDAGHPWAARLDALAAAGIPRWVAPGTSAWLTILGRTTNMRADIAESARAGLEHGAAGLLNTDWGDNGHLQYLPVSDPGLAYGAAMSWCADANAALDLGAALSAHCYYDPTGALGAVVVELGDVYLRLGPQVWNVASMVLHLYFPQLDVGRGPLRGATVEQYDAVVADLDALDARLDGIGARREDAALVVAELRNAMALVRVLAADACARLAGDGSLAAVDAATRGELALRLAPVIAEHDRLWLARNRPGGLRESRAWLEHLRTAYETGVTDRAWSGPR
ncbi:MAG: family 20 glycosylhydrolase [Acidimicrobiia bacterium]